MGQVSASSTVFLGAEQSPCWRQPRITRPCARISFPQQSDYRVLEGGQGAGTVAMCKLRATKSRVCDVNASWSRMIWANCTSGPARASLSGGGEYRTWKAA